MNHPTPGPTSYKSIPGYDIRRPGATRIEEGRVGYVPPYLGREHVPAPPAMPTLTITAKGVLYLHTSIKEALGLRDGLPINLVPPVYDSYYWHLDLRPTAKQRIVWYEGTGLRARGILLPPGLVDKPLTLHLYTLTPEFEKYYPLLPSNAFAT